MASATIAKRRDRFYVRVTGKRGEKETWGPSGGFARKQDADRQLIQVKARLARTEVPFPVSTAAVGSMPFSELADTWFKTYAEAHVTANGVRGYRSDVGLLKDYFGDFPVGQIEVLQVDALVVALIDAGASPQTIRHRINRLKQIIAWGSERDLVARPLPRIKTPKVKRQSEPLPLRPHELVALLDEAPAPFGAVFAVTALHGLRPGELLALRWKDLTRPRLYVRLTKDSTGAVHEPKTGETRSLPLDPAVVPFLRDLPGGQPDDVVFPHLTTKRAQKELRAALTRAGVARADERVLYDLRHTYASIAINKRMDPSTVAHRLGNSVAVCLAYYAQWWEDVSPDGATVLSDHLDGLGRGPVGDAPIKEEPLPWEAPAHKERATGLEPATLSLGS